VNPRERVEAALRLEAPDRPPVTAWGHDFIAEWSPPELAASTISRARRFDWDIVKLQPRASCFAEAFGSDYRPSGSAFDAPRLLSSPIGEVRDWGALPEVDASHPALADQVEALAAVVEAIADERFVLQTVFSPFTTASYMAADARAEGSRARPDLISKDQARAVRHLRDRPDLLEQALELIGAVLVDYIARSLEAGASGIFYAVGGSASSDALSQAEYEELLLPHDLAVLASVPEEIPVFLHLCGPRLNFDLATALPVAAISWATSAEANPGLAEGRDRTGRAAVGGVPELAVLATGTPEGAAHAVHVAIEETGGRGVVIAPGCTVPPTAGAETLAAMAAAADARSPGLPGPSAHPS
jgi:uroporphyrinogen decarboxylase